MNISELSKMLHEINVRNGFWEKANWNLAEKLMLVVSEVAEACEADRRTKYADLSTEDITHLQSLEKVKQFKKEFEGLCKDTFEDELADIVIRVLDLAQKMHLPIEEHIKLKVKYNSLRGHKHGGKKY